MSTKKLVIYSTNGGKTIEHNATTWGELQTVLGQNGVSYVGMKAVDNNKATLENKDAILSDNMTNLFLYPMKTKSGADASGFTFSECRAYISKALESNEAAAKAHFNVDKNYTNKSTADLRTLISSYNENVAVQASEATSQNTGEAKTTTKAVGKTVKTSEKKADKPAKASKAVAKAKPVAETKAVAVDSGIDYSIDAIIQAIKTLPGSEILKTEAIQAVKKLEVNEKESEEDILQKEFQAIGKGLTGVRLY